MNYRKPLLGLLLIGVIVTVTLTVVFLSAPGPTDNVNQAPVLSIDNPLPDSSVSGIVDFNISIQDEETLTADIYIDGVFRVASNDYEWNTSAETDGRHTIRLSVRDSDGKSDISHFEVIVKNHDYDYPFTPLIKIMAYNIKESGLNDDWKEIIKQENPDIAVLVETGTFDDTSNEILNAVTSELNEYFTDEMPYDSYTIQNVIYSTTGEAILSRFPVLSFTQIDSVPLDDGTTYYVTHDFLNAVLDINGTEVHVFGAHLKASGGETNQQRRETETEGILNYMDNLGDVPIIYLGDQNSFSPDDVGDLAPSTTMQLGYGPMTMMLYPNDTVYGAYSSELHNFTDVYRTLNPDEKGYTFGGQDGAPFMRIDYIITNTFFDDAFINSTVVNGTLADSASDHYAVTAWLNWSVVAEKQSLHTADLESTVQFESGNTWISEQLPVHNQSLQTLTMEKKKIEGLWPL